MTLVRMLIVAALALGACGCTPIQRLSWMAPSNIDELRHWIYSNSYHPVEGEEYLDTFNVSKLARAFLGPQKPGVKCGQRALVMRAVLKERGYLTRQVSVYSSHYESGNWGHVFLEVYTNNRWQAQDPDKDLFYENEWGQKTDALAALRRNAKPCNAKHLCGWELFGDLRQLFQSLYIPKEGYFVRLGEFSFRDARDNPEIDLINHFRKMGFEVIPE